MAPKLFISYASVDDGPQFPRNRWGDPRGPIGHFKDFLETTLRRYFPGVQIFFSSDDLLAGQDWEKTLEERLTDCDVLIAVLSKNWKNSAWCTREFDAIIRRLQFERDLPQPLALIPVAYDLSAEEDIFKDHPIRRFQQARYSLSQDIPDAALNSLVVNLSQEICKILEVLSQRASAPRRESKSGRRVFLGYAFDEGMTDWRDHIRRQLERDKFEPVLIRGSQFSTTEQVRAEVQAALTDCVAAVQFLSPKMDVPDAAIEKVLIEIQDGVVRQHPGLKLSRAYCDDTKQLPERYNDLIAGRVDSGGIVRFCERLVKDLEKALSPPPPRPPGDSVGLVEFIYENNDSEQAADIRAYLLKELQSHGISVSNPVRRSSTKEIAALMESTLGSADYLLFYWGNATADWYLDNFQAMVDARRRGSKFHPPGVGALYLGPKEEKAKETCPWYPNDHAYLIKRFDGVDPEELKPFVQAVIAHWQGNMTKGAQA